MFVSLKTIFSEKKFFGEGTVASKIELDEVQQIEGPTPIAESESDLIRSNPKPNVPAPLRRSGRVPHQPDRYYSFLVRDGDPIELDECWCKNLLALEKLELEKSRSPPGPAREV